MVVFKRTASFFIEIEVMDNMVYDLQDGQSNLMLDDVWQRNYPDTNGRDGIKPDIEYVIESNMQQIKNYIRKTMLVRTASTLLAFSLLISPIALNIYRHFRGTNTNYSVLVNGSNAKGFDAKKTAITEPAIIRQDNYTDLETRIEFARKYEKVREIGKGEKKSSDKLPNAYISINEKVFYSP